MGGMSDHEDESIAGSRRRPAPQAEERDEGDGGDEIFADLGDPGEVPPAKAATDPGMPTPDMIKEHELTHYPFRSWCAACICGRGQASPHTNKQDRPDRMTMVVADYCFPGNHEGKVTVLVVKTVPSGLAMSCAVCTKGSNGGWIVRRLAEFLDRLGVKKLTFKCDQESSLNTVVRAAKAAWDGAMIVEHAPKGDSQANGRAENAVKEIEGWIRTWRYHVESKTGLHIGPKHPFSLGSSSTRE